MKMQKLILKIKDEYLDNILKFIKTLPEGVVEIDRNTEENNFFDYVIATEQDKQIYKKAQKEYEKDEFVSLEEFERQISDVYSYVHNLLE